MTGQYNDEPSFERWELGKYQERNHNMDIPVWNESGEVVAWVNDKGGVTRINGRLIAAAPELLKACEKAQQHLLRIYKNNYAERGLEPDLFDEGNEKIAYLHQVIARATGTDGKGE